ncbi:MAG: hypothetical protein K9N23_16285 [Akkermansiaceae bacterium]|nr:hypothetical protein [Akkermansiaceae bacterium]MCF7733250.1 hypothetical protein [Akkermansiaceae bacterium]
MNLYRQSIALFGIVVPILILALVLGLGIAMKGRIVASFDRNEDLFKSYQTNRMAAIKIEESITKQRVHLERWSALMSEDALSAMNSNLRTIAEGLPAKEFQKGGFERTAGSGGLGSATAQNSSQLKISFRGTFRTMQRAFLELETRMPQLQLQELRITPNLNQQNPSTLLNYQVTYLAWEN